MDFLTRARIWGLLGDAHGNLEFLLDAAQQLVGAGAEILVQLGDFGLVWDGGSHELRQRARLDEALRILDRVLYVVAGNHENFDRIEAIEPDPEGLRWVGTNVAFLPRAGRLTTATSTRIGWLSGANSIDRAFREPGSTWWPQEQITDADLAALGRARLDVLLGHDSPRSEALAAELEGGEGRWKVEEVKYADAGQAMYHRGFLATQPRLAVGGHYHLELDAREVFEGAGRRFVSRVVILGMERFGASAAVLDTETLEIKTAEVPLSPRRQLGAAGTELTELRKRAGLSAQEAAARLGIAASTFELMAAGRLIPSAWILDAARGWPELDSSR